MTEAQEYVANFCGGKKYTTEDAEDMQKFIHFAGELGILKNSPRGTSVAMLCELYDRGMRRLVDELQALDKAEQECKDDLKRQGVFDTELANITCTIDAKPKLHFEDLGLFSDEDIVRAERDYESSDEDDASLGGHFAYKWSEMPRDFKFEKQSPLSPAKHRISETLSRLSGRLSGGAKQLKEQTIGKLQQQYQEAQRASEEQKICERRLSASGNVDKKKIREICKSLKQTQRQRSRRR